MANHLIGLTSADLTNLAKEPVITAHLTLLSQLLSAAADVASNIYADISVYVPFRHK
jgi:hypothetical protein